MTSLLKYEIRKLFKARSFYICLAIMAVYIFLLVLIEHIVYDNLSEEELLRSTVTTAAATLQSALASGITAVILGIFCALFVCEDYSDGTLKNIYAKGYTRVNVYFAKFIALCIFSLAACILSWLCGYIFGLIYFESGTIDGNLIASLIAQFIIVAGYTAFFLALSMIIRKTGGSIAACIVLPLIISLVLSLIDSLLDISSFNLSDYWLDGLLSNVSEGGGKIAFAIVLPLVFGAAFTAAGIAVNRRQEV